MAVLAEGPLPGTNLSIVSKGADDVQCARFGESGVAAQAAVNRFASSGLRTLVVGRKSISRAAAESSGVLAGNNLEVAFESLERVATCLGVAALRDELQEGAAATVRALRAAGIKARRKKVL
jgi:magnesium-transporting ATPase (P-type)